MTVKLRYCFLAFIVLLAHIYRLGRLNGTMCSKILSMKKKKKKGIHLRASSLNFASISLFGGYLGRLDGSQAYGFVLKY